LNTTYACMEGHCTTQSTVIVR